MEPAIITFDGDLDLRRYPEVHTVLEAAKIAGEIVLFVHRSLRYGALVAIVPPREPNEWLTNAESIKDAHFRETRDEALALTGGVRT
jgi:hypothetical protein